MWGCGRDTRERQSKAGKQLSVHHIEEGWGGRGDVKKAKKSLPILFKHNLMPIHCRGFGVVIKVEKGRSSKSVQGPSHTKKCVPFIKTLALIDKCKCLISVLP